MALSRAQRRRAHIPPPPEGVDPDLDSPPPKAGGNIAADRLRSYVERIERLEEERKTIGTDIKEVKAEAKGTGFDVAVINFIIRERKKDKDDLDEFNTQVEIYKRALGMIPEI